MGEFAIRGFLFLFGAFALLSAGLKVRSGRRAGVGVSVLTLVEGLAGFVLMVSTLPGAFPVRVSSGVGMGTVALVLLSTTVHLLQMRALSRAREESEGHRLYTSITYGVGEGSPVESATEPEKGAAKPGGGLAEEEGGSGGSGESPTKSEAVDPITAAPESGHFDQEAFLKNASAPEDPARKDADAAQEAADAAQKDADPAQEDADPAREDGDTTGGTL